MKKIFIIIYLTILSILPQTVISNDANNKELMFLSSYENTTLDYGIVSFSKLDKIFKNTIFIITTENQFLHFCTELLASFIPTIKINSVLMTIKYGSTLISFP